LLISSCLIFELFELRFKDVCPMSGEKKMTEEKITEEKKLYEEKKVADPFIAGFYESMVKRTQRKLLRR
jgi:hypothetical protein